MNLSVYSIVVIVNLLVSLMVHIYHRNSTSLGDSIELKIPHEHPLTLLCLERCLRIAHRHASQTKHDNDRQSCQNDCFNGFLLGSTKYTDGKKTYSISVYDMQSL